MACLAWLTVFLVLRGGSSYILLTATLDDVQALARQVAASPVADQLGRVLRRASVVFNQQLRQDNTESQNQASHIHHERSRTGENNRNFRRFDDPKVETKENVNKNNLKEPKPVDKRDKRPEKNLKEEDDKDFGSEDTQSKNSADKTQEILSEEQDNDDINVKRHESSEDADSHTDEVVALGKNASFYLNAIKKIMETV